MIRISPVTLSASLPVFLHQQDAPFQARMLLTAEDQPCNCKQILSYKQALKEGMKSFIFAPYGMKRERERQMNYCNYFMKLCML